VKTPELVVFDCDGVLIDSELIACGVDAACFTEAGLAISRDEIMARYVGISTATMIADIERRSGRTLPTDFPDLLQTRLRNAFETELRAMPGVKAMLAPERFRRCVASSSSLDRIRHSLALTDLLDLFDPNIFSATQVAHGKPAPDLFLLAANRMGTQASACLVVEDSIAGVQAAVAAEMPVFGFTGGGHCGPTHGDRLLAAGAALVFEEMRRLPDLIDAEFRTPR